MELLLRYGADPIAQGWWNYEDKGATALHVAARVGDPDLLEVFLRYGADFHVRTDSHAVTISNMRAERPSKLTIPHIQAERSSIPQQKVTCSLSR